MDDATAGVKPWLSMSDDCDYIDWVSGMIYYKTGRCVRRWDCGCSRCWSKPDG